MRPRKLELHGFTAFRDPQEVDFSQFDLFVITGPTGAGKTSLLDAMALALYGQVPRMGKQGLGQLVSHGKAEARILLEFDTNGDAYRVSRRLPRNGAQQGRLERWSGEQWVDAVERGGIRAVNEAILDIVKLDFESFCKAIVLPQGEFSRFLKGEPGERRKTLVALLGLGAYERMGALARERAKALGIKGEQTRTILAEQYGDATPETLDEAKQTAADASNAAETAAAALAIARAVDQRRSGALERQAAATRLAERFAELAGEFTREVGNCRAAELAHREATARYEAERGVLAAATGEHASAILHRARVADRTGTLEALARVTDALAAHTGLDQRVDEAERAVQTALETLAACDDKLEECGVADAAAKTAAESALADENQTRAEARVRAEQSMHAQQRLAELTTAAQEHAVETTTVAELRHAATAAADDAAAARAKRAEAEAARDELRQRHLVAALVAGLSTGDACPVCERPLAEHPAVEAGVEQRLAEAGQLVVTTGRASEAAQRAAADVAARVAAAETRVAEAAQRVETALGDCAEPSELETVVARTGADADAAEAARAGAEQVRRVAEEQKQAAALELAKAEAARAAAERELQLHEQGRVQAQADRGSALEILHGYFGESVPADASERLSAARAELREADVRVEAASRAETTAREAFGEADTAQRDTAATLSAADVRLGRLRMRAEGAVEDVQALSLLQEAADLPEPLEARDEIAEQFATWCSTMLGALEAKASAHADASSAAAGELLKLAAAHDLVAADAASALIAVEGADRAAIQDRGRAEESLARLGERVAQRQKLEVGVADDATRIAVLDVLATELRADHFTEFVIQETLDVLAVYASRELLRISDARYSLISQDGDFSVIDHVNADEQRSVKTLSGGETFMASLSLALALSRHVSDLAGEGVGARLEAVFIDEGFGSLDPETLEEVIDALERLREDDLLVGVISHVPALAERIGVGLQVKKDGNRSVVTEAG